LEEVRRRAKAFGLRILLINVFEHTEARKHARHFCEVHGVNGPVAMDEDAAYANQLGVRGIPINVIVDKKGIIRSFGVTSPDEVKSTLMRLMKPF